MNGPNQVYPLDGFVPEDSPAQRYRIHMVATQVAGARFLTHNGQPNMVALGLTDSAPRPMVDLPLPPHAQPASGEYAA